MCFRQFPHKSVHLCTSNAAKADRNHVNASKVVSSVLLLAPVCLLIFCRNVGFATNERENVQCINRCPRRARLKMSVSQRPICPISWSKLFTNVLQLFERSSDNVSMSCGRTVQSRVSLFSTVLLPKNFSMFRRCVSATSVLECQPSTSILVPVDEPTSISVDPIPTFTCLFCVCRLHRICYK